MKPLAVAHDELNYVGAELKSDRWIKRLGNATTVDARGLPIEPSNRSLQLNVIAERQKGGIVCVDDSFYRANADPSPVSEWFR